jgi:hypothetical protein
MPNTMLYKFKSKATADVIYTEMPGRRLLQVLGKAEQGPGILSLEQMPDAALSLERAALADDQARAEAKAKGDPVEAVGFRVRSQPFVDMLKRAQREEAPISWGV